MREWKIGRPSKPYYTKWWRSWGWSPSWNGKWNHVTVNTSSSPMVYCIHCGSLHSRCLHLDWILHHDWPLKAFHANVAFYLVHHGRQQRHLILNNHKRLLHLHCYYYLSKLSSPSKTFPNTSSLKTKKMPLSFMCNCQHAQGTHLSQQPKGCVHISFKFSASGSHKSIDWWFINLSNHMAVKGLTSIFYNR